MVHCSPHKHCNRGNVAILAIQGSGNKTTSGKTKVFGRVLSTVQLPDTCPSQRRKTRIKAPRRICTLWPSLTSYFHHGRRESCFKVASKLSSCPKCCPSVVHAYVLCPPQPDTSIVVGKKVVSGEWQQDKSFCEGLVFCTIACHLPVPEEENEDLSAPLHMYFVLPNPILPSRFGQERFFEAVIKGSAHNNYTHRILLSCRQQLIFLWQWICNLPSPLLTLHLLGVNSSKQFISRAWVVVLTSITVCLGVRVSSLPVCVLSICCGGHNKCSFI